MNEDIVQLRTGHPTDATTEGRMIRWARRLVLIGSVGVALSIMATACSSPTAPRLPETEEEEDTDPPDDS